MSASSDPSPPVLVLRWQELTAFRYRRSRKNLVTPWFIAVDAPGPETFRQIADQAVTESGDDGLTVVALDEFAHLHPDFGEFSRAGQPALGAEIVKATVEFSARLVLQALAMREHLVLQYIEPLAPRLQLPLLGSLLEQGGYVSAVVGTGRRGPARHVGNLAAEIGERGLPLLSRSWESVGTPVGNPGPVSRPLLRVVAEPEEEERAQEQESSPLPAHDDPERQRREAQLARILSMLR